MPSKRRRRKFTTEEIQTATLLITEGGSFCSKHQKRYDQKVYRYRYPKLEIAMCDREALVPASRVFGRKLRRDTRKVIVCPPHLFPPDGKGRWGVTIVGKGAENLIKDLSPLLTKEFLRKWEEVRRRCAQKTT